VTWLDRIMFWAPRPQDSGAWDTQYPAGTGPIPSDVFIPTASQIVDVSLDEKKCDGSTR
jgi:hypothetical protein